MRFTVSQRDEILVHNKEDLFFRATVRNFIKYRLRFYIKDEFVLETSSFAFALYKKVWIKEQNLPFVIEQVRQKGCWGFTVEFDNHLIYIKQTPFRNTFYKLYLDGEPIGEVKNANGITIGRHYVVETNTEDELLNLYLLISFVIQFIAL